MGLQYSFNIITEIGDIDSLISSILALTLKEETSLLTSSTPWEPEGNITVCNSWGEEVDVSVGIKYGSNQKEINGKNHYCIKFLLDENEDLVEYVDGGNTSEQDDKIAVGCVWLSLFAGEDYALIRAVASTTDMSLLFEKSNSLRELWQTISKQSSSVKVFFDRGEEVTWEQISPNVRTCVKPNVDLFSNADAIDADAYCYEIDRLLMYNN